MRDFAGVLCDLDGTLVDSEPFHIAAWNEIADRYGLNMPNGWDLAYVGKTDRFQAEQMRLEYPFLPDTETLLVERHGLYQDFLQQHRDKLIFPGTKESLAALQGIGVKLAVGSNSPMDNCVAALEIAGIAAFFPVIVAFGVVKEGKPAPDIYLEAAKRIGLPPEQCVVIEDTEIGLSSGKAAGCYSLGVTTTHRAEDLPSADKLFDSPAQALTWLFDLKKANAS